MFTFKQLSPSTSASFSLVLLDETDTAVRPRYGDLDRTPSDERIENLLKHLKPQRCVDAVVAFRQADNGVLALLVLQPCEPLRLGLTQDRFFRADELEKIQRLQHMDHPRAELGSKFRRHPVMRLFAVLFRVFGATRVARQVINHLVELGDDTQNLRPQKPHTEIVTKQEEQPVAFDLVDDCDDRLELEVLKRLRFQDLLLHKAMVDVILSGSVGVLLLALADDPPPAPTLAMLPSSVLHPTCWSSRNSRLMNRLDTSSWTAELDELASNISLLSLLQNSIGSSDEWIT
ncbi:hypothetical protein OGATHE_001991 [Ogataea polymorpha]|uniref:Uncharacterized protein n=1 Tax=Ogataea polymorpha TaxID=460523 RepID=A0A9P8TCF0_9ASCO|nr:hypothetical protein OGATHE_001991 [Ogataea polymorpha]